MKVKSLFPFRDFFVCFLVLFLLSACAVKVPVGEFPEELQITRMGSVSSGSPIAWHPDGNSYAVSDGGLKVKFLNGDSQKISSAHPTAISWSPTGAYLAASFSTRNSASIRIFTDDFSELANIEVEGSVGDLAWSSDAKLLLAAVNIRKYSFGGNYRVTLHRWQQNEELKSEVLADTSPLISNLEALGEAIYDTVHLRISPYRDEIIFTRLLTPPNVDMHYKLVVRHLETGAERVIASMPLGTSGGRYLQSGARVFFSDGLYQSINRSIWGTEAYETYPPGLNLEISPGGLYKIVDRSFLRDRERLFEFNRIDRAAFSPDGKSLLFTVGHSIFRITNLEDTKIKMPNIGMKLLELRRWRSEGLITPLEYEKYSRKLEKK